MRLKGLGVSPGVGVGRAVVLHRGSGDVGFGVAAGRVQHEIARLHGAREAARAQLQQIKARLIAGAGAGHAHLFDAQLLMLDDPMLIERAAQVISDERVNAESALQRTLTDISALFDRGDDPYLRERKGDVADIVGRLCGNLRVTGERADAFRHLDGPLVIVADELSPSLVAQLDWQRIAALVSDEGLLDVSHCNPRQVDPHPRGGRAPECERDSHAGIPARRRRQFRRRLRES